MSLDDILEPWAVPHRVALRFEGATLSYADLADRVAATAAGLAGGGVGPGDRVGFCGLNRVEVFDTLLACARLGALFLPLNNRLSPGELAWQIADAEPAIVLTTDGLTSTIGPAAGSCPVRDLDEMPFGPADPPAVDPGTVDPGTVDAAGTDDHDLLMVYTSGTTGRPKGAVLTQRALRRTIDNSVRWLGLTGDDVVLNVLPTFHVGGLNIESLPALAVGATLVLHRRFDPGATLAAITDHRPTHTVLVPAMLSAMAAHPAFPTTDLSCLTAIATGSSMVPRAAVTPFLERGVPVAQVYGATESGPTSVVMPLDQAMARPTSAGRPAHHSAVRVVDPDTGVDRRSGIDGEVWLQGPNLFDRYWRNPDATAAAFADGWYRTGDIGRLDGDGYLWISDRRDDLIVSGGENVYPAEVESVLVDHPGVAELTVVGRPDERWGQVPVAVIVPAAKVPGDPDRPAITVEELRRWSDGQLARFKQPREVVLVDSLPRTSLGKVQKHLVRRQLGLL